MRITFLCRRCPSALCSYFSKWISSEQIVLFEIDGSSLSPCQAVLLQKNRGPTLFSLGGRLQPSGSLFETLQTQMDGSAVEKFNFHWLDGAMFPEKLDDLLESNQQNEEEKEEGEKRRWGKLRICQERRRWIWLVIQDVLHKFYYVTNNYVTIYNITQNKYVREKEREEA